MFRSFEIKNAQNRHHDLYNLQFGSTVTRLGAIYLALSRYFLFMSLINQRLKGYAQTSILARIQFSAWQHLFLRLFLDFLGFSADFPENLLFIGNKFMVNESRKILNFLHECHRFKAPYGPKLFHYKYFRLNLISCRVSRIVIQDDSSSFPDVFEIDVKLL